MSYVVDFDSGVDGATIAPAGVISGVRGTPVFENTPSAHGGMAGRFSSGTTHASIQTNTSPTTHSGSLYLYIPAENDTHIRMVSFGNLANSTTVCNIRLKSNRTLSLADATTVDKAQGVTTIPLNQWVRVDWQYNNATPTAPVLKVRLFLNAEDEGSNEEISYVFTGTTNTFERINFGIVGTAAVTNRTVILDTIRVFDGIATWPEPFNPPAPPAGATAFYWMGGEEIPVTSKLWNGTSEVDIQDPQYFMG